MFCKKADLQFLQISQENISVGVFLGCKSVALLIEGLQHSCVPVNFEFFRTAFFIEHGYLYLKVRFSLPLLFHVIPIA